MSEDERARSAMHQAIDELAQENYRAAVEREKAALRAAMRCPWWRRLLARLSITPIRSPE
jgi:hypothetical protein